MTNATSESSVYYHHDDRDDPFVDDPNRARTEADYEPCLGCHCNDTLATGCRCSCHSQRRHH